jgi:hypothetical protein
MFSNMLVAEKRLLEHCKKGKMLNPGKECPTEKMADNEIRGAFLRALILSNNQEIEVDKKKITLKIDPKGVMFSGIYISGTFDFSFCNTNLQFSFKNSRFENGLNLSDSKIRFLSLIGSIVPSLDALRLVCESSVFLNGFEAQGKVNFGSAQIGGSFSCIKGKFINEVGDALTCDKIKIKGSVFLKDGFEAQGKVNFNSAQIGSNLECINGKFTNEKGDALNCNSAKIDGVVFLEDGFEAKGKVNFGSAQIGSSFSCTKGKFINEKGDALFCDKSKIVGSVLLNKVVINGNVNFNLAKIGASLNCIGSKFENINGDSLNFNGSNIKGNVLLKNGFLAKGEVDFSSSQIGNNFDCSQGRFISNKENKNALNCERIKILGDVKLNNNFYANGEVNFYSARINGNLNCDSGNFINKNENAYSLYCQNIEVLGDVFLREKIYAKGDIDFYSAKIGRTFVLNDGWIKGDLILLSAKIDELDIDIKNCKIDNFILDGLQYNHFKAENIESKSLINWLEKMPKDETFKPQPYKQLAKVLRNMGHHNEADDIMIEYNNKIFNMDFKDFKERFKNRISIFFKEKRNFFKNLFKSFFEALGFLVRLIYGKTAGYGYKPMRVIFTIFVILLGCGWFYQKTADMGIFAPSNPLIFQNTKYDSNVNKCGIPKLFWKGSYIAYKDEQDIFYCEYKNIEKQENIKNDNWTTNQNLEGEYTTFSPYWYSLDILLPIVDLQMDKDWGVFISPINSDITLNHVTRWIVWIEILFGWIYSLILVAILSGLAKNEKD